MILIAYGTRPEILKIQSVINVFDENNVQCVTLFTGQHANLIGRHNPNYIIDIVDIPYVSRLDCIVKSIMGLFTTIGLHPVKTDYVLVQGDTTTALAVALTAFHNGIKVIHLEAGLRTYDNNNPYPEEVNRKMISQIADIHLCPTEHARLNLVSENITKNVFVVGNTVIDNLLPYKSMCEYTNKILVTMHRRENHHWLDKWFIEINELAKDHPEYEFILPIHPNPNVMRYKHLLTNVNVIDPLSYDAMLSLLVKTRLVITDSGGLQEESSFFNKKCLTCRIVTERPEAIGQSTFMVESPSVLKKIFDEHIDNYEINYVSPFGDGHSAEKILKILKNII